MIYLHKILPFFLSPLGVSLILLILFLFYRKKVFVLLSLLILLISSNSFVGNFLFSYLEHPYKPISFDTIKKSDARPFKIPEGITLMVVDPLTGQKAKFSSKDTIIEAYKSKNVIDGKVLYSNNNRLDSNNILKFY